MKKFVISGCVGALLAALALIASRHCWLSNAEVYRRLTGTWVHAWGNDPNLQATTTFGPGGSYVCQISGFTNGAMVKLAGKWQVNNGSLIDTATNLTSTNATAQAAMHGRIVRLTAGELVTKYDAFYEESVGRKVSTSSDTAK